MQDSKTLGIKKRVNGESIPHWLLSALMFSGLIISSHHAYANPFASSDSSASGICPSNHKMYYIGANPPSYSPIDSRPLSWSTGSPSGSFSFDEATNKKTLNINFLALQDLNTNDGQPPFYGSINGVSDSAINLSHDSTTAKTNHILDISVNRAVSKIGYSIQDLDSTSARRVIGYNTFFGIRFPIYGQRTPYIEQVDVSINQGLLTFNDIFHTINTNNDVVTAKEGENCGLKECNIDASWGYQAANNSVRLKHNNSKSETNGVHTVGYSDFYFCLAPPKLIVKIALTSLRVNDSDANRDQFKAEVAGGSIATNSFTTIGSGATINNDGSAVLSLTENTSYTITEKIMNGAALGDGANYNAVYTCTNAATGNTSIISSGAMTYSTTAKTHAFTLSNVKYGDEITCTITNNPLTYNFSGIVFNDNGGITEAQADVRNATITSGTYNNTSYFNGLFDASSETGIANSIVSLLSCTDASDVYTTQVVTAAGSDIGKYQLTVPSAILAGKNAVCLTETSSNVTYPIRTTTKKRVITLTTNNYNYPNNDFGRVIDKNAALVLEKEQAANNCQFTDFNSLAYSKDPLSSSTTDADADIRPGQCIAYKITATNRSNIDLNNFVMQDVLQRKNPNNPADGTVTSVLADPPRADGVFSDGLGKGQNGTVTTISATLPGRSKRSFYFNTQYGSTQSN